MDTIYLADGIGQQFADAATGGPILLGLLAAALAGLVSFASPCVIPLVPGYVSYLTGISGASGAQGQGLTTGTADATSVDKHDGDGGRGQRSSTARVGLAALLFVLGFTVIFVLGSASIFGLVSTLRLQARTLTIVGGVVTIVMGLAFMGMVPALQKDTRMAPKRWTTWLGAPLLGAVFALGWTPCLGPTLTAIISVSAGTQGMTAARGVALIIAYCLGLGLPFILVALGSARAMRGVEFLRKHSRTIQLIGGVALVLVGIALVTGLWDVFVAWVQAAFITDTVTPI
ncbi:cytochrome c biogenesis CcdA family protein [Corynebacterium sp. MSK151]|uniref:cytochrome c biogenesis CcdA family protein n=1 Tax=unclassified Corynebacterium TaxID=2624378 RepID=UPI0025511BFB|nr:MULTISPECIES: cytochrome c biogenesis CcdA family protein [unclassified Corynebacterium]MDK8758154.1 cytochrome c biogenesis CcdA family protein [Corynebacterium sp. MSK151]MDK8847175.1 cytochrome c biogenesis CcdA family protein [Corynebacterium sp. MSK047]